MQNKTIKIHQGLIKASTLIVVLIALCAVSGIASAGEKVMVRYDKTSLETDAGLEQIYTKVTHVAHRACGGIIHLTKRNQCHSEMLADFVEKVADPRMSRYVAMRLQKNADVLIAAK